MGAVAQLGERLNGIQEVVGSIPISSTNLFFGPDKEIGHSPGVPPIGRGVSGAVTAPSAPTRAGGRMRLPGRYPERPRQDMGRESRPAILGADPALDLTSPGVDDSSRIGACRGPANHASSAAILVHRGMEMNIRVSDKVETVATISDVHPLPRLTPHSACFA